MSRNDFVSFLRFLRDDEAALVRYENRCLSQVLFHARNEGYTFRPDDVAAVVGPLEYDVVTRKDGDAMDGGARLWRHMWSQPYLRYLVRHVVARYDDDELRRVTGAATAEVGS